MLKMGSGFLPKKLIRASAGVAILAAIPALFLANPPWLPQSEEEAAEQAAQKIELGDLSTARRLLDAAVRRHPRSASLHKLLASLEFKRSEEHTSELQSRL